MTSYFQLNRAAIFLIVVAISCSCVIQAYSQITVRTSVDGQNNVDSVAPPDAHAAVGPNHIVSWGNDSLMILSKNGTVISSQNASTFFGFGTGGDGHVIYDEISGRFAFEVLAGSSVGFAVSDTSDPTGPWHKISIPVPGLWDGYGGNGIGYNADAYVVHVNGFNNQYAVIAASNNVSLAYTLVTAPAGVRIGRPAPMTTAPPGGPFYFVEGNDDGVNGQGGTVGNIEVLAISNILSSTPTYTDFEVPANNTGASVINVAWRNNLLGVTGFGPAGSVNWYLISTSNNAALLQSGNIVPANNAGADVPSIAVAPNGSLGLNYTAADSSNITTMYVTGRLATDAPGMMHASQSILSCPTTDGRWGDYSSTVVDINSAGIPQNTFWACNEYLFAPGMFNWHTRVANFSLDTTATNFGFELPHIGPGTYLYSPSGAVWTFNGSPGSGSGLIANGSGFSNPNAPEGTQAAFVQSYGAITQTLSGFTPGTFYTITYSAAQRPGGLGTESWNVVIDGNVIKANTPGSTTYTTYSATFTATATTHTLAFVGTDLAGGDRTVFFDNVRISPTLNPASPSVAVASPASNSAFVALATVNLTAAVTTNGNRINGVQYFLDGGYVGQVTSAPYNYAMVNVGVGTHNVVARLNFNDGSVMDSAPVSFYVINRNPNYSFEAPSLGSGNYSYNPSGAAWLFSGQSGIAANGSGFGNPNAPQGTQAALVQSYGSFAQVLSGFTPGILYTITYSAAQRSGGSQHGGESWNVAIDNTPIKTNSPGLTSYTTYTATFTASAVIHTLSFVGTDLAGGDNTVFIDNLTINPPIPLPVPAPVLTRDTLPATATMVVGDRITFTATFNNAPTASYQWQVINGGAITAIPGATNFTLTLTNLQLTDAGLYRLEAINATNNQGVADSTASPLTVNNMPAAVTNIITAFAAQTGLGSVSPNFAPPWTVAPGSLITGKSPSSVGSGNFSLYGVGGVGVLTDGTFGSLNQGGVGSLTEVMCGDAAGGAGQSVTYTLTGSASGYNLTNITVYGGWGDAGRDSQDYTVYYSKVSAPSTFILLRGVSYNPANPAAAQSATRVTLTPASGFLAMNVAAVKFDFTTPTPENDSCGYSEIQVFGTPTPQPVKWALGDGNWDTTTLNWRLLAGGSAANYIENNLAAFDDSATGSSPITVALTSNHSPSVVTNNSTKNYILAGNYSLTSGSLIKNGSGTLAVDNGGVNNFSTVTINAGTVQVGNNDANGSLGAGNVTNNGALAFNRTDTITVTNTISGTGSVVQNGSGTVVLLAANIYAGNTIVSSGTLALVDPGSISASALISVSNGAILDVSGRSDQALTLSSGQTLTGGGNINGNVNAVAASTLNPGDTIGTMTVQSNVTLNGLLLMELNRTNVQTSDQLASVNGAIAAGGTLTVTNLGPALQAGDTFQLFSQPVNGFSTINLPPVGANAWANNLANNGTLAVVSTASPNLMTQLAGGNQLTLTWPADHAGWRLQVQTNTPAQGLGTNWFEVAGSSITNQVTIPIDPANGSVFYRLLFQ